MVEGKKIDANGDATDVKYGLLASELKKYASRGQATSIAHFYKLVEPGLILARHIFKGLERPLCRNEDMEADQEKFVHSRTPSFDWEWRGDGQGGPVRFPVQSGKAFVVIISPNINHLETYPDVAGWIERWNWVKSDSGLPEAPDNWVGRYNQRVWTRQ